MAPERIGLSGRAASTGEPRRWTHRGLGFAIRISTWNERASAGLRPIRHVQPGGFTVSRARCVARSGTRSADGPTDEATCRT